jgi:hypothetical protein
MTPPNRRLDVFVGMLILALCHAIFAGIGYAVHLLGLRLWSTWGDIFMVAYLPLAIGVTQLIYVIPLCLWLRRRRQLDTMNGVIIAAIITVLLNGGCFFIVLDMISNAHY